jgi:hypothetical protein
MNIIHLIFWKQEYLLRVALLYCGIRVYFCVQPRQLYGRSLLALVALPCLPLLEFHLKNFKLLYEIVIFLIYALVICVVALDAYFIYASTKNINIINNKPRLMCGLYDIIFIIILVVVVIT